MNRLEIYRAALKQAINNGYAHDREFEALTNDILCTYYVSESYFFFTEIFRTDFAKSFWGERKINYLGQEVYPIETGGKDPGYDYAYSAGDNKQWPPFYTQRQYDAMQSSWQFHQQQMVISDDPLIYLEKGLK